jgi:methyl-accepting chemotaxis protein
MDNRRIKLINAPLQIKLTLIFVGMAALSLLLQIGLFTQSLARVARDLPNDGPVLWSQMSSILSGVFLTSTVVFLPVIFIVGILATFRIAGPLHRFKLHLASIAAGQRPTHVVLRKGDECGDLCELLNSAIDRASSGAGAQELESDPDSRHGVEIAA